MFNKFSRCEEQFAQWRRDGMPGLKGESYKYIEFLTSKDDDRAARDGTLWPHQWESFLRVVYAHEILGKAEIGCDGLLLNVVTGGGKTAVIAALIAWLRIAHDVQKFVLLCPNLIVRDRLEEDFDAGKVFRDRDLLPDWSNAGPGDFVLTTLGSGKEGGWASLFSASVILGNIHQFYQSNRSGQSNLSALMNGPDFALFNDEAHNSPAPEYEATLQRMREKIVLRVDTTATPDRADGQTPDSDMVYEYGVTDALHDGIIKTPVVYQPDIKTVQLTYTDGRAVLVGERGRWPSDESTSPPIIRTSAKWKKRCGSTAAACRNSYPLSAFDFSTFPRSPPPSPFSIPSSLLPFFPPPPSTGMILVYLLTSRRIPPWNRSPPRPPPAATQSAMGIIGTMF
jgi:type III restriction enzyme